MKNILKRFFSIAVIASVCHIALAENEKLYASDAKACISTTVTIPINMKNSVTVRDYSFSLVLPEEILPSSVTLKKSTVRKENEMSFRTAVQSDGSIKVVCYSTDGLPFEGNDGEVATLTFIVPADMEAGDYPIIIKNAELSENGKAHKIPDEVISRLTIYLLGDANSDGIVSASDIAIIEAHLNNKEMKTTFDAEAADVTQDGEVTDKDVKAIAEHILLGTALGK